MLKTEGKITDVVIENMMNWRHSGFNVYCGKAIWPRKQQALENLARYIIRASFSQERMTYIPAQDSSDGVAKVIYQAKHGHTSNTFEALDWLAQHDHPYSQQGRIPPIGGTTMAIILISHEDYGKKPASMIRCRP